MCWSKAYKSVLLVQPSLAAAERVFSILCNSFTDRQEHALRDYIETLVMLQYNCRQCVLCVVFVLVHVLCHLCVVMDHVER